MHWWRALPELLAREDVVLVTVAQTRGSVPREAGTSMLVTLATTVDTIGGGHLEWEAMAQARAMLLRASAAPAMHRLSLGASLGQCCGGVVWLVFERIHKVDRDAWMARVRLIDGGASLTRELANVDETSRWAVTTPDEVRRNPGACLDTYASPSPGSSSHPLPTLGEGTTTLGPDSGSSLSQAWGAEGNSDGMPSASAADWQCNASGGAQSGVPRQGRERGNGANGDMLTIKPTNSPTHWQLTHHLTPPTFNITLFGAGHVGAAIANILATLDASIRWVDVRDDLFGTPPANVSCITTDAPEDEVDKAPRGSYFLVLTHSHALDLQLTERILRRDAFAWFGLIGSRTKRARFEHRLHAQGIAASQLTRMTCPIGVAGISDKSPQAIAISVVAQLLQAKEDYDSRADARPNPERDERELTHDD